MHPSASQEHVGERCEPCISGVRLQRSKGERLRSPARQNAAATCTTVDGRAKMLHQRQATEWRLQNEYESTTVCIAACGEPSLRPLNSNATAGTDRARFFHSGRRRSRKLPHKNHHSHFDCLSLPVRGVAAHLPASLALSRRPRKSISIMLQDLEICKCEHTSNGQCVMHRLREKLHCLPSADTTAAYQSAPDRLLHPT